MGTDRSAGGGGAPRTLTADELRFGPVLSNTLATQSLAMDLGTSIGDFAGISASGSINFDASVGLSLILGFYLGGASSESLIDGTTLLSSLNDGDGAGIKEELAVTGTGNVRTLSAGCPRTRISRSPPWWTRTTTGPPRPRKPITS